MRALRSRGPDSSGFVDSNRWSLGVARLSITDPICGHQPIRSRTGRTQIVFNGAIYNTEHLKRTYGLDVATGNDAEVALALYERYGVSFTDQLDGMYAFVIADEQAESLVFGVDEIGIKPLHLARDEGSIFLCSTLQALGPRELARAERVPAGTVWDLHGLRHVSRRHHAQRHWIEALTSAVDSQTPHEVSWGAC